MQVAKAEPEAKGAAQTGRDVAQGAAGARGFVADRTRGILGFKYYTFISQVENGFGRVPTESMEGWARALGVDPAAFARELLSYYDPELHRLLFEVKR